MEVKFSRYIKENIQSELDSIAADYGIKDVSPEFIEYSEGAKKEFMEAIDIFDDIKIVFVKRMNKNLLGKFRSGTATSTPIILMSEDNILQSLKKYKVSIETAVTTTIYHELGHAICELDNEVYDKFLNYDDEEDWVEDFAHEFYQYGTIPTDLEEFVEYKKSKNY